MDIGYSFELFNSTEWKDYDRSQKILHFTLLALKDKSGFIPYNKKELQNLTGLHMEDFIPALKHFISNPLKVIYNSKIVDRFLLPVNNKYKIVARTDRKVDQYKPLWRENTEDGFNEYIKIVDKAYTEIQKDLEWLKMMKEIHPRVLIGDSLDKSYKVFWGTKRGWENKRKKKTTKINMVQTIKNTISLNFVYLKNDQIDHEIKYIADLESNDVFK